MTTPTNPATIVGLNLSGAERGTIPGTYGVDYQYDGQASLNALRDLGVKHLRVPIRMERLQPTPAAAFDATEATRLDAFIGRVAAAGMTCKLAAYQAGVRVIGGVPYTLGTVEYPVADHVDFFSRLAARYAATPAVVALGYHQPHDLPSAAGSFVSSVTHYDFEPVTPPVGGGFGTATFGTASFGT